MTDVIVKRLHKPLLLADNDGSWYTVCHACTAEANRPVILCTQLGEGDAWPPFKLVEQEITSAAPPAPDYAQLAQNFNRHLNVSDLRRDLLAIIEDSIRNRPRSQQKEIGPSEIGHECARYLGYKLHYGAQVLNPAANEPAWRPQVGVAVHEWLAQILGAHNESLDAPRFLIEHRVNPCSITLADGSVEEIRGSGDAYDSVTGTVVDWKIVGPTTLKKVKAVSRETGVPHGASQRYRIQGHTYGKGYARLGLPVEYVMIAFLPAAGELGDGYFHIERWDERIADEYAQRLQGARTLLDSLPTALALSSLPTADSFCGRCPYYRPDAGTLDAGCPGHADRKVRRETLLDLIPAESVT